MHAHLVFAQEKPSLSLFFFDGSRSSKSEGTSRLHIEVLEFQSPPLIVRADKAPSYACAVSSMDNR